MAIFISAKLAAKIYAFGKLVSKTGNPRALIPQMLVPLFNLGVLLWLAFSQWPLEKRLKEYEDNRMNYTS